MRDPGPLKITHAQAIDAVLLVIGLADLATEGGGMAAEMHLGRPVVEELVRIRDAINAENGETKE